MLSTLNFRLSVLSLLQGNVSILCHHNRTTESLTALSGNMLTHVYIQHPSFNLSGIQAAVRFDYDLHQGLSSPVRDRVEALPS